MLTPSESDEVVPLTFRMDHRKQQKTTKNSPLSAESALDRDTHDYTHHLLEGKFNPRYLESFGELLSAIRAFKLERFDLDSDSASDRGVLLAPSPQE